MKYAHTSLLYTPQIERGDHGGSVGARADSAGLVLLLGLEPRSCLLASMTHAVKKEDMQEEPPPLGRPSPSSQL